MASQMIPSTSEAVPLIVVFFTCNMMIVAFSVVFNVFILSLHYRTPDTHTMSK
uniref:Neurotransmitter-gated ion-channel transmembrane domain-containing protein n=1 Tax=Romanomermis culicivorax TaxID=13658 RepID=A0A915KE40_ROMCU